MAPYLDATDPPFGHRVFDPQRVWERVFVEIGKGSNKNPRKGRILSSAGTPQSPPRLTIHVLHIETLELGERYQSAFWRQKGLPLEWRT